MARHKKNQGHTATRSGNKYSTSAAQKLGFCYQCGKWGLVAEAREWVDGWDGRLVYRYRCIHCGATIHRSVESSGEPGSETPV